MAQFRSKNPRKMHNNRGEPVFDMTEGKELLRQDIKDGLHLKMTPTEFQTPRPQYLAGKLPAELFKFKIYQEERRQKYFHSLELKSVEWKKKRDDRRKQVQAELTGNGSTDVDMTV